jgi:hypothetical protein
MLRLDEMMLSRKKVCRGGDKIGSWPLLFGSAIIMRAAMQELQCASAARGDSDGAQWDEE